MTTARNRDQRGAALATAMLLTLLLLTLGMSFLTFCQNDLKFQRQQQAARRAQNLARDGIEYWNYLLNKPTPAIPANNGSIQKEVIANQERFIIRREATGISYSSIGQVIDQDGNVIAEREIFVTGSGQNTRSYDTRL